MALLLSYASQANSQASVSELSWLEKNHLQQQVDKIDELARLKLGRQIHGDKSDLEILQKIIHRGLIARDDIITMQAMGVVMGNVMVADLGLVWKVYKDKLGESKATCLPQGSECLFPITMLSRRMEVGLLPDVEKVYNESTALIKPYLPKMPFSEVYE